MIELAKHIEVLLLENDCVIVPGLGGFIAHRREASFSAQKGEFMPPLRTVGFNPQLTMNDGLLAQSYMQTFNTDFPDATRRIEKTVAEMKDCLYRQGQVSLGNVGTVYYNMSGGYSFEPASASTFTPGLYGLESFTLAQLQPLPVTASAKRLAPKTSGLPDPAKRSLPLRHLMRNIVAVAAAVCLFFALSVPVENTYIDHANYASLGAASMFDAVRDRSVATSIQPASHTMSPQKAVRKPAHEKRVRNNVNTLKPVAVKTEKIAAASPTETAPARVKPQPAGLSGQPAEKPVAGKKKAYVIVASLATPADARHELDKLRKKGYKNCQVLESDGRFRVALDGYATPGEAYRKVQSLRSQDEFKSAWVFTSK